MSSLKDKVQEAYDDIPNSNEKPLYYYCEKEDVQEAVNDFNKIIRYFTRIAFNDTLEVEEWSYFSSLCDKYGLEPTKEYTEIEISKAIFGEWEE